MKHHKTLKYFIQFILASVKLNEVLFAPVDCIYSYACVYTKHYQYMHTMMTVEYIGFLQNATHFKFIQMDIFAFSTIFLGGYLSSRICIGGMKNCFGNYENDHLQ